MDAILEDQIRQERRNIYRVRKFVGRLHNSFWLDVGTALNILQVTSEIVLIFQHLLLLSLNASKKRQIQQQTLKKIDNTPEHCPRFCLSSYLVTDCWWRGLVWALSC